MRKVAAALFLACAVAGAVRSARGAASTDWAVAVLPGGAEFTLEVAADDVSRARGYMFREKVGPHEGMLFLFDETDRHSFWMKNCKVSLDILWLDEAHRIVHIAASLPPCPVQGDCPSTAPLLPARYVLEFAAGTAKEQGLKIGDQVVILSSSDR
jgi:uncharacterized membrane protein (UPF0127 family)